MATVKEPKTRAKTQKRARINFTAQQLDILEDVFATAQYPDAGVFEKLAAKMNLPVEKILTWFQNRRSKFRKESKSGHIAWMRKQMFNRNGTQDDEAPTAKSTQQVEDRDEHVDTVLLPEEALGPGRQPNYNYSYYSQPYRDYSYPGMPRPYHHPYAPPYLCQEACCLPGSQIGPPLDPRYNAAPVHCPPYDVTAYSPLQDPVTMTTSSGEGETDSAPPTEPTITASDVTNISADVTKLPSDVTALTSDVTTSMDNIITTATDLTLPPLTSDSMEELSLDSGSSEGLTDPGYTQTYLNPETAVCPPLTSDYYGYQYYSEGYPASQCYDQSLYPKPPYSEQGDYLYGYGAA